MTQSTLRYFRWPFIITALGLLLSAWIGWIYSGTLSGTLSFFMVATVLAVLEISLSFDNAIVNANKLRDMHPEWQRRFLTWGILIAVFGMRIVFPLLIVVIAAKIGPWDAIVLATTQPEEYAHYIEGAHIGISAFGGAFLMMVGLTYFMDEAKEVDWIASIERTLRHFSSVRGIQVAIVLAIVLVFVQVLPPEDGTTFLYAACLGLMTFLGVEVVSHLLDRADSVASLAARGGLGAFLYLEVLDASFSFDGVIGAFALTKNLFIIAIGLGIGAMYVRAMTIMVVEKKTLSEFRYLEHGAFWSILVLAVIMFAQSIWSIHEAVTGLLGATLIGAALVSSMVYRRKAALADQAREAATQA